jgi:hypothetical protein
LRVDHDRAGSLTVFSQPLRDGAHVDDDSPEAHLAARSSEHTLKPTARAP